MLKKLMLTTAALVLGLAVTGEASAAGHGGPHGHGGRPYYSTAGVKFKGGYYYSGRSHSHWGGRVWNTRYNRYHYWDPYLSCYYYWYAPRACYLPVGCTVPF